MAAAATRGTWSYFGKMPQDESRPATLVLASFSKRMPALEEMLILKGGEAGGRNRDRQTDR